jgi:hypothetical protein
MEAYVADHGVVPPADVPSKTEAGSHRGTIATIGGESSRYTPYSVTTLGKTRRMPTIGIPCTTPAATVGRAMPATIGRIRWGG